MKNYATIVEAILATFGVVYAVALFITAVFYTFAFDYMFGVNFSYVADPIDLISMSFVTLGLIGVTGGAGTLAAFPVIAGAELLARRMGHNPDSPPLTLRHFLFGDPRRFWLVHITFLVLILTAFAALIGHERELPAAVAPKMVAVGFKGCAFAKVEWIGVNAAIISCNGQHHITRDLDGLSLMAEPMD